jgi:hypothetical protein
MHFLLSGLYRTRRAAIDSNRTKISLNTCHFCNYLILFRIMKIKRSVIERSSSLWNEMS